jgi:hypothetical protein
VHRIDLLISAGTSAFLIISARKGLQEFWTGVLSELTLQKGKAA